MGRRARPQVREVGGPAVCDGRITYKGHEILQADIDNFKAALGGHGFEEAFLPAASPTIVQYGSQNRFYASDEDYAYAVAEAMKTEYRATGDPGFILQIDAPGMPAMYDRYLVDGVSAEEYGKYASLCMETVDFALEGIDPERVRYHICWAAGMDRTPRISR